MQVDEFLAIVAVFAIIVIPCLAITARFALRPIVEAIIVLRDGLAGRHVESDVESRLTVIESELAELSGAVRQLVDVHRYERELSSGASAEDHR